MAESDGDHISYSSRFPVLSSQKKALHRDAIAQLRMSNWRPGTGIRLPRTEDRELRTPRLSDYGGNPPASRLHKYYKDLGFVPAIVLIKIPYDISGEQQLMDASSLRKERAQSDGINWITATAMVLFHLGAV